MIIISRLSRLFVRTLSLSLWRNKITRWLEDINCILSSIFSIAFTTRNWINFVSSCRHWISSMYFKVLTRYLCIHRLNFVVYSAKKGEVEDVAAAEGTDESSGVMVLTRWQSDNHYLVPFQQGSNIPVKIHNDKSVLKNCCTQMDGNEKETTRKNSNSMLQPLVASIKTVLSKKNNNSIRCLHGWHRQVRKYSK